jgi:hypothetical protein
MISGTSINKQSGPDTKNKNNINNQTFKFKRA